MEQNKKKEEKYISNKDEFYRNFGNLLSGSGLFEIRIPEYKFAIVTEFENNKIHITNTSKNNLDEEDYHIAAIPLNSYCCYSGCNNTGGGGSNCCAQGNSSAFCRTGICWCCCET